MSGWRSNNGRNSRWSEWINYSPSNLHHPALSESKWLVMEALISARAACAIFPSLPLILPSLKSHFEFYCLIKTKPLKKHIICIILLFLSAFPCLVSTVLTGTNITLKYKWGEKKVRMKAAGQLLTLLGCQYFEGENRLKNRLKRHLFWWEKFIGFWTWSLGLVSKFVADFGEPKNGLQSYFHNDQ